MKDSMFLIVILIYVGLSFLFSLPKVLDKRKKGTYKNKNINVSNSYSNLALSMIKNHKEFRKYRIRYYLTRVLGIVFNVLLIVSIVVKPKSQTITNFILVLLPLDFILVYIITKDKKVIYEEILPKIIGEYMEGLKYNHAKGMTEKSYRDSGFGKFTYFHSEDLIKGSVFGTDFMLSEVLVQDDTRVYQRKSFENNFFKGTFAEVNLKKAYNGDLSICSKKLRLFRNNSLLFVDNTEFDQLFDAFASNHVYALSLLTPDVTSKMVDLYNETGILAEYRLLQNKLYIRFFTENIFAFRFSTAKREAKLIGGFLALLDGMVNIIYNIANEVERFDA